MLPCDYTSGNLIFLQKIRLKSIGLLFRFLALTGTINRHISKPGVYLSFVGEPSSTYDSRRELPGQKSPPKIFATDVEVIPYLFS